MQVMASTTHPKEKGNQFVHFTIDCPIRAQTNDCLRTVSVPMPAAELLWYPCR